LNGTRPCSVELRDDRANNDEQDDRSRPKSGNGG
jgi:hypothetical protein